MAVYSLPAEFENDVPTWGFDKSREENTKTENDWLAKLKAWAIKRNPEQECVGETLQFPVADGYAIYMVLAIKPIQLVHLPLGDAYQFQYANRLTAKDIREQIASSKRLAEFFAGKKAEKDSGNNS